jgi:hypothetical protein
MKTRRDAENLKKGAASIIWTNPGAQAKHNCPTGG